MLNQKVDCVISLANTAGDTALVAAAQDLKAKANDLDYRLEHNTIAPFQREAAHNSLHEAEELVTDMCDHQTIENRLGDVQAATTAIEAFL